MGDERPYRVGERQTKCESCGTWVLLVRMVPRGRPHSEGWSDRDRLAWWESIWNRDTGDLGEHTPERCRATREQSAA